MVTIPATTPVETMYRTVVLNEAEVALCREVGLRATTGAPSHVPRDDAGVTPARMRDTIVGMMCEYAWHRYYYGTRFPASWLDQRAHLHRHPHDHDGGSDMARGNVDVKGSYMRASDDPTEYRLFVRPSQRGEETVYVQALVAKREPTDPEATVYLMGWLASWELPPPVDLRGQPVHMVPVRQLHPLMPLRWLWG